MQIMSLILSTFLLVMAMSTQVIFDFNSDSDIQGWKTVDDSVMGGVSSSDFTLSPDGYGLFEGRVSLENNGGFSSLRYRFKKIQIDKSGSVVIKLKGDGKKYQFRIKNKSSDYYSYIYNFETSGEWEEIEIPLSDFYPSFRGMKLDIPNFAHSEMEGIGMLIGNKKAENFILLIDKIELK